MKIRLGENIRELCKQAGLTQEQLAEALGVTTGAVYKWESGRAFPELELLVEIGRFFETSVDALLGYGWETMSMGKAVEKLRRCIADRQLEEGIRFAEQALEKYPNSFQVVLKSADIYFLTMKPKYAARAVELYRKALQLMDQNTDGTIGTVTIQRRIASCYCHMDRKENAVELLKQSNVDGINNHHIGQLLSQDREKAEEALPYLSQALIGIFNQLYHICIGCANAYEALGKWDEITEIVIWFLELETGLRDGSAVTWMDKCNVGLFLILAKMERLRGNEQGARSWLTKARDTATMFDAAPEYRAAVGLKFCHGSEQAAAYDDMGETAMDMIGSFLKENADADLRPLWEEIQGDRSGEASI